MCACLTLLHTIALCSLKQYSIGQARLAGSMPCTITASHLFTTTLLYVHHTWNGPLKPFSLNVAFTQADTDVYGAAAHVRARCKQVSGCHCVHHIKHNKCAGYITACKGMPARGMHTVQLVHFPMGSTRCTRCTRCLLHTMLLRACIIR
jgi:hypothetical protein